MEMARPKRVFISYSWDSPKHKAWVRYLAEQLQHNGVNTRLDQWHVKTGDSFTQFMEEEIAIADYILVICTPDYARKSNSRKGGVGYEQQIVSGQLIGGIPRSRFVPIIRSGEYEPGPGCSIPTHFQGIAVLDFREDQDFMGKFEELLRAIFNIPKHIPPQLGSPPQLVSSQETSLTSDGNQNNANEHSTNSAKIKPEADRRIHSMNMALRLELTETLLEIPAVSGFEGRSSLLLGIPNVLSLRRDSTVPRTDIVLIVGQLENIYLETGKWALLVLIDNALPHVRGTNLGVRLQTLRDQLR